MRFDWLNLAVILFLLAGMAFAVVPVLVSLLVAPKAQGGDMAMPYECGIRPHGSPKVRFGINYYFYALLFLAFDVDVLYLFPAAAAYPGSVGWMPFWEIVLFVAILAAAVLYFRQKGVFTWPRRISL